MTTLIASLRKQLSLLDAFLFGTGVAGLFVFFSMLPSQHPDSAAQVQVNEEETIDRARSFIIQNGFLIPNGVRTEITLRRDTDLLSKLQTQRGRPETVRFLQEEGNRVPAYYWHAEWTKEQSDGGAGLFRVASTLDGSIFRFHSDPSRLPVPRVIRPAIEMALRTMSQEDESSISIADIPDSTLLTVLSFDLTDTTNYRPQSALRPASEPAPLDVTADSVLNDLQAGHPVRFGEQAAASFARYHLGRTIFQDAVFEVDSVRTATHPAIDAVTIYLHTQTPFLGQDVSAAVSVAVTGQLLDMNPFFNQPAGLSSDFSENRSNVDSGLNVDYTDDGIGGLLTGITYVFLVLLIMITFARRLSARVVDTKSALQDALWGGFIAAGLILMTITRPIFQELQQVWLGILIIIVIFGFSGSGAAFLVFMASGAMDSLSRSVWSKKLATLDSVRHGLFRSVPVGAAILRGLLVAFFLSGGLTVLLLLFPDAAIQSSDIFARYEVLNVAGYAITKYAWLGLFVNLTVMLGIGTMLYQWKPNPWVVIPGMVIVLILLGVSVVGISPFWLYILFSGFIGLVLAGTFWRYDYVTSVSAYAILGILWITKEGWMIEGSTEGFNTMLTFIVLGFVGSVGFMGLMSRKTATEIPDFTPDYVQELAKEERVKGELEIAYKVQTYLLPRKMPSIKGLDLAGMCLPALDVGGDYYDFVELSPGRLAIVVGDVSGKGIQAAFYMTLTKGFIQTLARSEDSPAEVLRRLNHLFYENVPRGTFISMIYGVIEVETGTFTFARAGHNPIILRRSPSQNPEIFRPDGMGIGLDSGPLFDDTIIEEVINLRTGDVLVFYTDGFSEAMNLSKELYGDDRLARRVGDVGHRSANEILRAVSEDVHHFLEAAGRHDDMTMVVVKMMSRARYAASAAVSVESSSES